MNLDKQFLEHQYSPSRWSNVDSADVIIQKHCQIIIEASKQAVEKTNNIMNLRYGEGDCEKLDIFLPNSIEDAIEGSTPVLLFIHGGYWQELGKEFYSFIGKVFCSHGLITAVVGYDLAPKVKLSTIFQEIKKAIQFLRGKYPLSQLFVCGHSAGAHLASLLLKVNWPGLVPSELPIKGIILISGLFDLRPIVNTYINDALKMDDEEAWSLSPMKYKEEMKSSSSCKVLCLIGQYESPEFHRQSKDFCNTLEEVGFSVKHEIIQDTDHFSVIHNLALKDFRAVQLIIDMIRKATKK